MCNIEALDTAKQALIGMDGLKELVEIKNTGYMKEKVRKSKNGPFYFEEIKAAGGYFSAVEKASLSIPDIFGTGVRRLKRSVNGGIGAGTVYPRDSDYFAPVLAHFGYNNTMQFGVTPDEVTSLIGGCTFEDRSKIQYIDELDERQCQYAPRRNGTVPLHESDQTGSRMVGDGTVVVDMTLPTERATAEEVGKAIAQNEPGRCRSHPFRSLHVSKQPEFKSKANSLLPSTRKKSLA